MFCPLPGGYSVIRTLCLALKYCYQEGQHLYENSCSGILNDVYHISVGQFFLILVPIKGIHKPGPHITLSNMY